MRKLIIAALVIIAILIAWYFVRSNSSATKEQNAAPVEVTNVSKQDVAFTVQFSAKTEPYQIGQVVPQVSGQVLKDYFTQGAIVKQGDLLFEIDPRKYQYALEQAQASLDQHQAQLAFAEKALARYTKLDEQKYVSDQDFEQVRLNRDNLVASVEADKANLNNANLMLGYCKLTAPVGGVIGLLNITIGNFVEAYSPPLVTINRIAPIYINFDVDEAIFHKIKELKDFHDIEMLIKTADNKEIQGAKMFFIDNQVNPNTGSVRMKALYDNDEMSLWADQFVKISLAISKKKDALVIPDKAMQMNQVGNFVYVVKEDNTAQIRQITVDFTSGENIVVKEGLSAGETIVTDGQLRLKNGSLVKIIHDKTEK